MERKRWIFQILTIVVLFVGFGVQQITYAESDSNIGKFEYEDNSLKPTESTGFPPKEEEKDKNFFIKTLEFGKKKFKEFVDPIVDAGKDAINYVGEKISDGYELTKDKAQDGMQAMNEWWMEQNGWTKSAFILGGGALALAGAVIFTPLAAGAALVMGAGGGLSYGMYALTTDNISFFGGLAWMGLGIASGGASLFLRGAGMAAWGARGSSLLGAGIRGVGGFLGRTALVSGGLSAALAGGTHLYRYFVHGEPINPLAMAKDMVVWGAAGTIAGPLGRFAMAKIGSRLAGLTVGSGVAGTSEYTLGNLFQGKMPNIKTAGKVLTISLAVPVLGLAIAKGAPLLMKGTTTPVAQTTTQITDTAFSQTGKTTTNVVETGVDQGTSKTRTIINGDNHITVNPVKNDGIGPLEGLNKVVAGDDIGVLIRNNDLKTVTKAIDNTNNPIRTYRQANISKLEAKYTADPKITVDMPYVGKGKTGTNAEGWLRDKDFYWNEIMKKHPESLSKANKQKIKLGFSPINDKTFREHFPQYDIKELYNDTLIHHHIGGGGQAAAVPSKLHPGTGGIHNAEKAAGVWGNDSNYAKLLEKFLNM